MPYEGEAVIFELDFKGKATATAAPPAGPTQATAAEVETVEKLNGKADEFAKELQQEVEQVCQPFASGSVIAQVELEFEHEPRASVVALGAIAAAFVTNLAAGALAPNLAKLIENAFRHFFQRQQRRETELFVTPNGVVFEGFSINVSPRQIHPPTDQAPPEDSGQAPPGLAPDEPRYQGTGSAPTGQLSTPWLQVQQQTSSQPPVKQTSGTLETGGAAETRDTYWIFPAIAIGIALIIVLLAVILTIVIMQIG